MGNKLLLITSLFATLLLTACGWNDTNNGDTSETGTTVTNNNEKMDKHEDGDTALPNHSSTGDVPEGLKEAKNPKFPIGSKVTIKGDHMEGMLGSEGTVVGAYDTTVYSVSYTPTNGNEFQENHKWVIKEEIKGYGEATLDQGAEVVINADHEPGMRGATGVIDTVEDTTVYMVNFTSTTGETVASHKWLKESELSAE